MSPRRNRPGTRRAALALAAAVALGACTVENNDVPVELGGSDPFGLLVTTTTTTSTTVPEAVTKEVEVWFLDAGDGSARLEPVPRNVDVGADIQEILANLFTVRPDGGERPAEAALTTAIPESATLLSATPAANQNRLVVDVQGIFGSIQGDTLRNALAQIVWTATATEGISEVVFRRNGVAVEALVDDGEVAEGAVTRADYARGE